MSQLLGPVGGEDNLLSRGSGGVVNTTPTRKWGSGEVCRGQTQVLLACAHYQPACLCQGEWERGREFCPSVTSPRYSKTVCCWDAWEGGSKDYLKKGGGGDKGQYSSMVEYLPSKYQALTKAQTSGQTGTPQAFSTQGGKSGRRTDPEHSFSLVSAPRESCVTEIAHSYPPAQLSDSDGLERNPWASLCFGPTLEDVGCLQERLERNPDQEIQPGL